jgi:maltodextrin utilization protein YvdJ
MNYKDQMILTEISIFFSISDSKSAVFSILIGVFLIYLEAASGLAAVLNYSETIFTDVGSTLSPALSTVIVGLIMFVGSYGSTLLIERAGRKVSYSF